MRSGHGALGDAGTGLGGMRVIDAIQQALRLATGLLVAVQHNHKSLLRCVHVAGVARGLAERAHLQLEAANVRQENLGLRSASALRLSAEGNTCPTRHLDR